MGRLDFPLVSPVPSVSLGHTNVRTVMSSVPNKQGRFGAYGGRYVPETLMPALLELEQEYAR